ncbi:MAG: protein transporter SEC22 [Amphiamblys sp. WSBS2006]|nr:MAG: protein transporter SEC22 [Amphiamblys sp. WSBS2006]
MAYSVIVFRVKDCLPLCATMDDQDIVRRLPGYKTQAKQIVAALSAQENTRGVVEAGDILFSYLVKRKGDTDVCFMFVCEKGVRKKQAFVFLERLGEQFVEAFQKESLGGITRPYALIRFDSTVERSYREYIEESSDMYLTQIEKELGDVSQIVSQSIKEFLERGEKIDRMGEISSKLVMDSKKYAKTTYSLNLRMALEKYGAIAIGVVVVLLFFYFYFLR